MDDERLICLVREHPELYNKKTPLYKYKDRKRSVWAAIGKELQWPGELCARRWTALRERFSKESRKVMATSDSGEHSERSWHLLEPMMFLKPHIIPRPFRWSKSVGPVTQPQHEEILLPIAWSPDTSLLDGHSAIQMKSEVTQPSPVSQLQSDVSCSGVSDSQSVFSPISPPPQSKPLKRKIKCHEDSVEELMVETINSFKSYCEARGNSQNSMVDGFANFMKSTLSTVDRAKQTRIIKHVTTIVMDAVADPNY